MGILVGGIIGGLIGALVAFLNASAKSKRYKNIMKTITEPVEYSALYHYASFKRYKTSFKYYDSYGALYVVGKTAYYKAGENENPVVFNLTDCTVQPEPEWRWLQWFSITTPAGEKFYFNSSKLGTFKNNSDETLAGLTFLQSKMMS